MPRPEIFGTAAARKKRARKPWTLQRTIFNTFIAFIYLSLSSVFSGIFTPLCWVRPESGPEGLDLSDEQSGWITAPSGPENGPPSVALGSRTPGSGIPQAPARSTATVPLCQEVSGPQKLGSATLNRGQAAHSASSSHLGFRPRHLGSFAGAPQTSATLPSTNDDP